MTNSSYTTVREMDSPAFLLCACFVVACISLYRLLSPKNSPVTHLPPGPAPLPVVGSLFELGPKPNESLAELARAYGPVMTLRLGRITMVVLSSAAAAKEALQKHDQALAGRPMIDSVRAAGYYQRSIAWHQPDGYWRKLRMLCNKWMFNSQRLDASQNLRQRKVWEMVSLVAKNGRLGQPVAIGTVAIATMLNVISNTIFSVDVVDAESERAQEFRDIMWGIMEEVGRPNIADYFPFLAPLDPQGIRRRTTVHFKKMFAIFDILIEERLRDRASTGYTRKNDFMEALLDTDKDEAAGELTIREMKSLFLDLYAAGSETSSVTVEWGMAELLHNPEAMAKVRKELDDIVGKNKQVEESDIARLPYLRAVVKETLRLHPPVPLLLPHQAEREVEICGHILPKSTRVIINSWAISRDSDVWPDPTSFTPERFIDSAVDYRSHDFEFIPFGAGRRISPGLPLGDRMSHLMLASLLHSFDWELPDGMGPNDLDMSDKFGVTLQKLVPLLAVPINRVAHDV